MAKVKDDSKLQIQLKIDKNKDREIFNVLDVADNKSDFIKDALFYYIYQIESGKVINRNYPYNKVNIKIDIAPVEPETIITPTPIQQNYQHVQDEVIEEVEEYDYEDDNFDDVEI